MTKKYLYFDIESHNAGKEYDMPTEEFIRLVQYAWDDGPVEMFAVDGDKAALERFHGLLREAEYVVGHNIINFDLSVAFGPESTESLEMCMKGKVLDTFVLASLLTPAPDKYRNREGKWISAGDGVDPGYAMRWLSLDNLCHQFKLPGKFGSLKEMAKRHNPPKTRVADLDYGLIPLDDEEFLMYAEQDIIAVRGLFKHLMRVIRTSGYDRDYLWRELKLAGIAAQMSRNGVTIDTAMAQARVDELAAIREERMAWMVKTFDFPTEGAAPWRTNPGKEAIMKALASYGITPETYPDWELTATGNLSLGGKTLKEMTEGTPAEELGETLATLMGQRSLAQLALDSVKGDGKAHPNISALQRSGRWSVTEPGLTVWTKNEEKKYICAAPGNVFVELDFSNADARAMGAVAGDENYLKRFEKDENGEDLYDGHNLTGEIFFGPDVYYGDGPRDKNARPVLRDAAKAGGHALNYGTGAFKLAITLNKAAKRLGLNVNFWCPGVSFTDKITGKEVEIPEVPFNEDAELNINTRDLIENYNRAFPFLRHFKEDIVEFARKYGYVVNDWGRRMLVQKGREKTQAPALIGQSTTREMMGDTLIRLVEAGYATNLKTVIHDALLAEVPEAELDIHLPRLVELMTSTYHPKTEYGIPIEFPVGVGVGKNWYESAH